MDITEAIRAMDITESNSNSTTKIIRKKRASQGNASEVVGKSDASAWVLLRSNVVLIGPAAMSELLVVMILVLATSLTMAPGRPQRLQLSPASMHTQIHLHFDRALLGRKCISDLGEFFVRIRWRFIRIRSTSKIRICLNDGCLALIDRFMLASLDLCLRRQNQRGC